MPSGELGPLDTQPREIKVARFPLGRLKQLATSGTSEVYRVGMVVGVL